MIATRGVLVLSSWLALGCPSRGPTGPLVDPTWPAVTPPPRPTRCGDATTRFADAAPLPADTTLVALLDPTAADFDGALALLEQHVRGGTSGLAVPTAFALAQWRWEVPMIVRALAGIGVHTAALAAVQTASLRVWVVPLGCPFDAVVARLRADFEMQDTGGSVIAIPRDRSGFAHDVVVRPDAIVLCPPTTARRVLAAWDRTPSSSGPPSLRTGAFALAPATVRVAVRETGLLDSTAGDSTTADHLIRVDGGRVDATLAP